MNSIGNGIQFQRFQRKPAGEFWAPPGSADQAQAGNPSHHTCTTSDTSLAGNPSHHTCTTSDTSLAGNPSHHTCTTADTASAQVNGWQLRL
ncbi:hypothetical protein JST97_34270 [bacterium]|nr:hypothetical protein [bacterium]